MRKHAVINFLQMADFINLGIVFNTFVYAHLQNLDRPAFTISAAD